MSTSLVPIAITFFATIASIESSYYYYSTNHSPNHYYSSSAASSPNIQPSYNAYYTSRLSQPIYYVRPYSRSPNRPLRKFARSYQPSGQLASAEPADTIILNDTAVPFTIRKNALSTAEFETNPNETSEEGVGPAAEVADPTYLSALHPSSKIPAIAAKGSDEKEKGKSKGKHGKKSKKSSFEPQVVYSDVHPIYVRPPTDFKPVIYPNRRLDGVRATDKFNHRISLMPPPAPYPYGYPRGLSSWSLGGPKAFSRGNYWESLSTDEALNLQPEANTLYPSAPFSTANYNGVRGRLNHSQRLSSMPSFLPWLVVPSTASLYSYEMQYPVSTSSISILPLLPPTARSHLKPASGSRRVSPGAAKTASKESRNTPVQATNTDTARAESAEGIRTKLPVGLTSWFLGGVRDLTGKHWKMPDLSVDNVNVVPLDKDNGADDSVRPGNNKDSGIDVMMTSDGDYEKIVPVVSVPEGEREEKEDPSRGSGVIFDDDPEFVSANNNINLS